MSEYLFEHTRVERIQAWTDRANLAEQRALEKAGSFREGVLRGRRGQRRPTLPHLRVTLDRPARSPYARSMGHDDLPSLELAFPGPERDHGVAAILRGRKTALTGLLEIYEHAGEAVPVAGQRFSVLGSDGLPAVTIELVEVRVVPVKEIDDDFARAEGRGYADAAAWRTAHEEFFRSDGVSEFLGRTPVVDDDTLVVAQRFRVCSERTGPCL
ncbi:ASCH domain-containing protein [Streptomyces collinus]|uniref:ASCH domain-containing protein n=1 Tax=Streptomyces collinus TaxID=42684 RepID=UPI0036391C83